MRYLLVGLGNIGRKRLALIGDRCAGTVDPINPAADHKTPDEVPLGAYDAVIMSVPNSAKLELLERFLSQGKHVLIEKPLLFPDERTADRIEKLAQDAGVVWYTSYNHRFEPMIVALKERLEQDAIGQIRFGRMFYGNGTVGDVAGSWRDTGLGVIEDLGCHLLDLSAYLLGGQGQDFELTVHNSHISRAPDHGTFLSRDRKLTLDTTFLSWKNAFSIDIYGERGSLHVSNLVKWGPSEFIERQRVYPSGIPLESRQSAEGADPTWASDLAYFEDSATRGVCSAATDRWISRIMRSVAVAA